MADARELEIKLRLDAEDVEKVFVAQITPVGQDELFATGDDLLR
jgi:hypothetical protein